jgi:biotin operon repressor
VPRYTPTEKRMMYLLRDCLPHSVEQLHDCLDDPLSSRAAVKVRVSGLRKKLQEQGEDVRCEPIDGKTFYRWVRLVAHSVNE